MFTDDSIRSISTRAALAAAEKSREYCTHEIVNEADFTSQLLSSLKAQLRGLSLYAEHSPGFTFGPQSVQHTLDARVMKSRYARSEENLSGADILMGFRAQVGGENIVKGVLVQAKLFNGDGHFFGFPQRPDKRRELISQCLKMKRISQSGSYVFIYSCAGVVWFTADEVLAAPTGLSFDAGRPIGDFFAQLAQCTVGDQKLAYMTPLEFEAYLDKLEIEHGFEIEVAS